MKVKMFQKCNLVFVLFQGLGALPGVGGSGELRTERPYFDDVSPRNVSAVVGQSAVLRCRAKHIGNRTVSKTNMHNIIIIIIIFWSCIFKDVRDVREVPKEAKTYCWAIWPSYAMMCSNRNEFLTLFKLILL